MSCTFMIYLCMMRRKIAFNIVVNAVHENVKNNFFCLNYKNKSGDALFSFGSSAHTKKEFF